LAGLEVLDLSWGTAGPMTSMLLADGGARVTRIESPHGDPVRDEVAYRVWNRGKRSAVLDLTEPEDREVLLAHAARADVVLESFEPGVTARLGIDEPALRALNPRLVYCSITGYGPDGPDAHRPAYDSLVAARTGLQWDQRGWPGTSVGRISGAPVPVEGIEVPPLPASRLDQPGPAFLRSTWPSIGATFLATVGISAALRAREVTGRGDHVRTSLLQGAMAVAGPTWQRAEHPDAPGFWMWVLDRRAPEGLFECADGRWVHFWTIRPTVVLEAAEHDELPIEGDTDDMAAGVRIGMEPDDLVILYHYHPLLVSAFRKFPSDRWVAFGAARGLGIALVRSPEEALADRALLDHGCVVEVDDPEVGTIRHAGVLVEFSDTPGRVQGPAPVLGQHTDEVRAEARSRPRSGRVHDAFGGENAGLAGPLAGVTVLDLGLGVAGPWGGRVLADLGAEVIKVHALHDGFWSRTHMGLATNWGKRSIAVDLKDPRGREVLDRLIARADVLAHNMRPGAAERLGIGYDELRERFPRLIYCHTRGFEDGPRSRQPGTDQTANALAGAEYEDGACHLGGPPIWSRINTGDTGNGYLWATAVIQALYHRDRTGRGQRVGTAIVNACLLTTSYAYGRADGTPVDRPRIDRDQKGLSALHGLYELADGSWLCVAALTDDHWRGLCDALDAGDLAGDARFATAEARARPEHDAALREALAARFAGLAADEAVRALDKHEVPAEISSTTFPVEVFNDPEIARRGWLASGDVPGVGRLEQPGVLVDLAAHPGRVSRPPCLAGQHSAEILAELGYDAAAVAELTGAEVVLVTTDGGGTD
jgi:crotonobetainyl-CoA:carnitine CoA-transferase CaiB-like acyl-CoA transferase